MSLQTGLPADVQLESGIDRKLIKKFREQIHALGGPWIILGSLALGIAGLAASRVLSSGAPADPFQHFLLIFVAGIGLTWLVLGVMTCLKHMWAVYVGLALSYVLVAGNLVRFNICGIVILVLVILQAHRVIGWANKMRAAGVPLDVKP